MEEFPMTRAFLQLLGNLTDASIPAGLGAGYRAPGFDPYLAFLRDSIFLKFNTRAYKIPAEKVNIKYIGFGTNIIQKSSKIWYFSRAMYSLFSSM